MCFKSGDGAIEFFAICYVLYVHGSDRTHRILKGNKNNFECTVHTHQNNHFQMEKKGQFLMTKKKKIAENE